MAATTAGGEPYLANRTEAFDAIQCSDSTFPTDTAIYSRMALSEEVVKQLCCRAARPTDTFWDQATYSISRMRITWSRK